MSKQNTSRQYDYFFGLVDQVTIYFLPEVNSFNDFMSCLTSERVFHETNCVVVENENPNMISWRKVEDSGYGCLCGQHRSPENDLNSKDVKAVMEVTRERTLNYEKQLKKIRLISFKELHATKTKELTQDLRGFHIQTNTTYRVEPISVRVLELKEKIEQPLNVFEELFQKWKDQSNFG